MEVTNLYTSNTRDDVFINIEELKEDIDIQYCHSKIYNYKMVWFVNNFVFILPSASKLHKHREGGHATLLSCYTV